MVARWSLGPLVAGVILAGCWQTGTGPPALSAPNAAAQRTIQAGMDEGNATSPLPPSTTTRPGTTVGRRRSDSSRLPGVSVGPVVRIRPIDEYSRIVMPRRMTPALQQVQCALEEQNCIRRATARGAWFPRGWTCRGVYDACMSRYQRMGGSDTSGSPF